MDDLINACDLIVGTVLVGVSADEPSRWLSTAAMDTMLNVTGVDLMSLVFRGKFVFMAQVGSPQKVVLELRDGAPPIGLGMDVLITGQLLTAGNLYSLRIHTTAIVSGRALANSPPQKKSNVFQVYNINFHLHF